MLLISYKYFEKIAVSKQNIEKNKKIEIRKNLI